MQQRAHLNLPAKPGRLASVDRLLHAAQDELERDLDRATGRGERAAAWLRLAQIRLSLESTGGRS